MPKSVQEDLEEYLNRLDGVSESASSGLPAEIPTIPRFESKDFAKLRRARHVQLEGASSSSGAADASDTQLHTKLKELYEKHNPAKLSELDTMLKKYRGREAWLYEQVCMKYGVTDGTGVAVASTPGEAAAGAECHICLAPLRSGEVLLELPCSQRHRFHERCIKEWLSKAVTCPLCRTDVKALLPAVDAAVPAARRGKLAANARREQGQTLLGGTVVCYERNPPPSRERPTYIPPHLRHLAQYLEVSYPGRGVARIWRVPNSATSDLSRALPLEV